MAYTIHIYLSVVLGLFRLGTLLAATSSSSTSTARSVSFLLLRLSATGGWVARARSLTVSS